MSTPEGASPTESWKPITVSGATVVELDYLKWTLSAIPDSEWISCFTHATGIERRGSGAYVLSGGDPLIHGYEVEWRVPSDDHVDANRHVSERVDHANSAYRSVLARRANKDASEAQAARNRQAAIDEAQRLLDNEGSP